MIPDPVSPVLGSTVGPTTFAALAWGAVALVLVVFSYVVRTLLRDYRAG